MKEIGENLDFSGLRLTEKELRLVFTQRAVVSEPDTEVFAYHFSMVNSRTGKEMGSINIKAGYTENIIYYRGNIGFTVFEPFRGNHLASRSCLLLIPLLKSLKINPVWLTCNIDNQASRKSIEKIGAIYQDTQTIPEDYTHIFFYPQHARIKLRYRWEP